MIRQGLLIAASAAVLAACATQPPRPYAPKALFITLDGVPADVIEAVATPNIDAIAAIGGYARAYVGGTIGEASQGATKSMTGYNSLLTGTWVNKHNVRTNEVRNPNHNYWDLFRIAKAHDPAMQTALFSSWTKIRTRLLRDGVDKAGGSKLEYWFDGLDLDKEQFPQSDDRLHIKQIDSLVAADAARYIAANGPDVSWVYLQYTDAVGHKFGDGAKFEDAVRFADSRIGVIWDAIQARQEKSEEDWLLIVTTDHGRKESPGFGHSGQSERERTIWNATNSKRLNARFDDMPGIVDVLPSIAVHLELGIPDKISKQFDGQSFIDSRSPTKSDSAVASRGPSDVAHNSHSDQ
jgi:arylsulfatase A-like enzyme